MDTQREKGALTMWKDLSKRRQITIVAVLWLVAVSLVACVLYPELILLSQAKRCNGADGCFGFYNAGNSDCSSVYTDRVFGLMDTGFAEDTGAVEQHLKEMQIKTIDFVVISHPHNDHAGAFRVLASRYAIKRLFIAKTDPATWEDGSLYQDLIACSNEYGVEVVYITDGMTVQIGDIHLEFYHLYPGANSENERSVVTKVTVNDVSCLYTGDSGATTEAGLLYYQKPVSAQILKVGHHGSNSASTEEFLTAVSPDYAVLCVGENNYGHPSDDVLNRLHDAGATLYRTDSANRIIFSVHDHTVSPTVE